MPNISLTLPETSQAISRPVVISIVDQVKSITKIDSNVKVFYPGDSDKMRTAGSELGSIQDGSPIFDSSKTVFIEVQEDHNTDNISSTPVYGFGATPIFLDKDLGISIVPIYSQVDLKISIKYRTHSRVEAFKWRDDLRLRISQMRNINTHVIKYHYLLPAEVLMVLKESYLLREQTLPYGQSVTEYVLSKSSERLTLIGDLVGKDARLGIAETQTRVYGYFDFEPLPDIPEKDNDKGVWTVTLNYKLTYDKPFCCHMRYPIMVHNKLLPFALTYFTDHSPDLNKMILSFQGSLAAMRAFESDVIMNDIVDPQSYIKLPAFDDYVIPQVLPGTGTILTALAEVGNDNKDLFNLTEMGEVALDSDILDWLKSGEYKHICGNYESIIQVHLYRNNTLSQMQKITCDANLNIKATTDLNLRNQHRIRISLVTDLSYLSTSAIKRIKTNPKVFIKLIGSLNEVIKNHPDFVRLGDLQKITDFHFSEIYRILTGYRLGNNGSANGAGNYYGPGLQANYYSNNGQSLFDNLDPVLVDNYRRNRVGVMTVMVSGILAILKR